MGSSMTSKKTYKVAGIIISAKQEIQLNPEDIQSLLNEPPYLFPEDNDEDSRVRVCGEKVGLPAKVVGNPKVAVGTCFVSDMCVASDSSIAVGTNVDVYDQM